MLLEFNSEGFNFSSVECTDSDEVEECIRKSAAKPLDEIWMTGEKPYPCLAILISGELACVDYFEDDEGHYWQSTGHLGENKTVRCIVGCEHTELSAEMFVPLEDAIKCAQEFFDTQKRSPCIEWEAMWE